MPKILVFHCYLVAENSLNVIILKSNFVFDVYGALLSYIDPKTRLRGHFYKNRALGIVLNCVVYLPSFRTNMNVSNMKRMSKQNVSNIKRLSARQQRLSARQRRLSARQDAVCETKGAVCMTEEAVCNTEETVCNMFTKAQNDQKGCCCSLFVL